MDHDIIADQPHIGAALDGPLGDFAARDVTDLGNLENLQDLRIAQHSLAQCRRQQAGHRFFNIVYEVVDDVVVANLDAGAFGRLARFLVGADIERDDRHARGFRECHV